MAKSVLSFLLLVGGAGLVAAKVNYIPPSQYCVASCGLALQDVSFQGEQPAGPANYAVTCTSPLFLDSLFACAATYCTSTQTKQGFAAYSELCWAAAGVTIPDFQTFDEQLGTTGIHTVSQTELGSSFNSTVIPDAQFYAIAHDTTAAWNYATYLNWTFAWALYGYWGLVILAGITYRALKIVRCRSFARLSNSVISHKQSSMSSLTSCFSRRLLIPLVYGGTSATSPPTRMEGLLVALYIAMVFTFCFPGYHVFAGNLMLKETRVQLARYISNRCGSLALANLPLVWIFATRNDPLLWLTGWSYATFQQFHRWTARTATALAISHGIGYSITAWYNGHYDGAWMLQFWYCGVITVISMSIMVLTSFYFVRDRLYDLFLILHFVFAMVVLVCVYFHTNIQPGVYSGFLWPCVAIWCLDRLLRFLRVAYFSFYPTIKGAKAIATFDEDSGMVRLDVTDFFQTRKPTPGSFFFVYEPNRLRGYESHPFTLCSWTPDSAEHRTSLDGHESVLAMEKDVEAGFDKELRVSDCTSPGNSPQSLSPDRLQRAAIVSSRHTFLIKPRNGFTGDLRRKTQKPGSDGPCRLTVLLEGPYGEDLALQQYSNVLMLVGGSGITSAISRVHALCAATPSTAVHLVWAVQSVSMADNVCQHELRGILESSNLRLDIYATRATSKPNAECGRPFGFHHGRPPVDDLVTEASLQARGRLAVLVCGPPQMTAACRSSVIRLLGEKGNDIAFYEERFGW